MSFEQLNLSCGLLSTFYSLPRVLIMAFAFEKLVVYQKVNTFSDEVCILHCMFSTLDESSVS